MADSKMSNVVAVVTGGASGLGLATVLQIVSQGGKAVAFDLNPPGDESKKAVSAYKNSVAFVSGDVMSDDDVQKALDTCVSQFGRELNVLVNCAGIGSATRTYTGKIPHPQDMFDFVVRVNLSGTFNCIRLASERMAKNPATADDERGVIVNTASAAAYDGQIGQAAYSASKAGVVGMTLPIARDLARHGIRCVTIAPGLFLTPLLAGLPEPALKGLSKDVPFPKRLGNPQEFAHTVQWIVENRMVNAETIRLDGGIRFAPGGKL
eukprot:Clim_evm7s202 gene=Clim_evmTU7s202